MRVWACPRPWCCLTGARLFYVGSDMVKSHASADRDGLQLVEEPGARIADQGVDVDPDALLANGTRVLTAARREPANGILPLHVGYATGVDAYDFIFVGWMDGAGLALDRSVPPDERHPRRTLRARAPARDGPHAHAAPRAQRSPSSRPSACSPPSRPPPRRSSCGAAGLSGAEAAQTRHGRHARHAGATERKGRSVLRREGARASRTPARRPGTCRNGGAPSHWLPATAGAACPSLPAAGRVLALASRHDAAWPMSGARPGGGPRRARRAVPAAGTRPSGAPAQPGDCRRRQGPAILLPSSHAPRPW